MWPSRCWIKYPAPCCIGLFRVAVIERTHLERSSFSINYLVLFIQYPKTLDKLIFTTSLVIYLQSQSLIHSSTKFLKLNLKGFFFKSPSLVKLILQVSSVIEKRFSFNLCQLKLLTF